MSKYINPGTVFPPYFQFPEFLLRAPISQTARIAYMILYDRARLSEKNNWILDGKVYTVYPIEELAGRLGKSKTTVKSVLKELEECNLLIRRSGGFSKANILYVLLPDAGQFSDKGQFSDPVQKPHSVRTENSTCDGQVSVPARDSFPAPSKVNKPSNMNKTKGVRATPPSPYGRYKNIFLSPEEYDRLSKDFPDRIDGLIEKMSAYCEARSISYQNYEAALRSWAGKNFGPPKKKPDWPKDYSCEEGESF